MMRLLPALSCFLLLATPALAAAPVTYTFTGRVTAAHTTGNSVKPGQDVPISITLDTAFKANGTPRYPGHEAVFQGGACEYPNTASPILAMSVAGQDAHGCYDTVQVEKNVGGISHIAISSSSPQLGAGLTITMTAIVRSSVRTLTIPKRIDPAQFKDRTFSTSEGFGYLVSGFVMK